MTKHFTLIILSILCMASNCEHPPGARYTNRFLIQNNSQGNIWYIVSKSYPDTTIPDNEMKLLGLKPTERKSYDQREEWEDFFAELPADTLSIFFFSGDSLSKNGFQNLRKNYTILERRDFGLKYLKDKVYTVSYP